MSRNPGHVQGTGGEGQVDAAAGRFQQLSAKDAEAKFRKKEGVVYGEDVDKLGNEKAMLEAEIQRLSTQVLQVTGERDALRTHSKRLGETLKEVRKSCEAHNIKDADLGVNLHRSFSLGGEEKARGKDVAAKEKHPRLAALKLMAAENGWLISPEELKLGKKVGSGSTADIYEGMWHGLEVAVKCLRTSYMEGDENSIESFVQEVELLARQRHPYVLRLFGASIEFPDKCYVITELIHNGTLTEWLHGEKGRQWNRKSALPPLKERLRMAMETSQAMQYLHEQKPMVIHRDLKPSNVFVDASMHVRVADFGFARYVEPEDTVMTGETGTYMYMAPEVVKHEQYSEKCDVYSFGIMLCELLTGNPPFIETYLTPMQMAVGVADGSLRPKIPTGVDPSLVSLVSACWAQDPSKRPTFAEISVLLTSHIRNTKGPEAAPHHHHQHKDSKEHKGLFGFMHSTH